MIIAGMILFVLLSAAGIVFCWKALKQKPERATYINPLLGLCAFSLIFFIFILSSEIYFRTVYDQTDSYGLLKTTEQWFKRHYHNNRMGVRDDIEYSVKKIPGRPRVVFLGDSFTAGHGVKNVSDRFANQIRKLHPEWEIHTIAANGFDTGEEIRVLGEAFQKGYEADVIVLIYCLNDISDIIPPWKVSVAGVYEKFSKANYLIRESFALNHFYYRLERNSSSEIKGYYEFVRQAYGGEIWEEQKKRLRLFRDVLRFRNTRLLVVTFPFLQEIGPDYSYREAHQFINRFWEELEVPHLDLLPVYELYPPKKLVVNRFDAHPNEFAHSLAAEAIGTLLQKQLSEYEN